MYVLPSKKSKVVKMAEFKKRWILHKIVVYSWYAKIWSYTKYSKKNLKFGLFVSELSLEQIEKCSFEKFKLKFN